MSFQSPLPQECYFYQKGWSEETVNLFIRLLLDDVKQGAWVVGQGNKWEIQSALDFINVMMNLELSWDQAAGLVNLLKLRYTTFKYVLEAKDVRWDRHYNYVHAHQCVWEELFKWNEFTKSFYHKGDAMHGSLKKLFETPRTLPTETIVISSDGPALPNSAAAPLIIPDSDGEQEVTSPDINLRKPPCKKLFKDLIPPTRLLMSAESQSSKNVNEESSPKCKGTVAVMKTEIKKESSSCASSSPFKLTNSPLGK